MKPSYEEALWKAQTEIDELKRLVCGLYSTGSFRSGRAMAFIGQASRVWVDNPSLRPEPPKNSR